SPCAPPRPWRKCRSRDGSAGRGIGSCSLLRRRRLPSHHETSRWLCAHLEAKHLTASRQQLPRSAERFETARSRRLPFREEDRRLGSPDHPTPPAAETV